MLGMTPGYSVDLRLALTAALVMGLRHGIDYDHIAAISDLSRLEESRAVPCAWGCSMS